ncbi:CRISPR-associated DxTHG motif protein [Marinobacter orientalis]|nr:CRISPR-associated DxTHG motif protein [Marinobacter orientalis]
MITHSFRFMTVFVIFSLAQEFFSQSLLARSLR